MIERITELTSPPEIGKFYLVPTVQYYYRGSEDHWPVIGPKHEDKAIIGFPHLHYHVDGRFLTQRQTQSVLRPDEFNLYYVLAKYPLAAFDGKDPDPHPPVMWKRKRYQRPIPYCTAIPVWLWKLQAAYQAQRLKNGICPHRGAHIGTIKPDENGIITCPLHGLNWKAATGELVRISRKTYLPILKPRPRRPTTKQGATGTIRSSEPKPA